MKAQLIPWRATVPAKILKTTYVLMGLSISLVASSSRIAAQNSYDIGTPAASKAGESTISTYNMDKIETVNLANGNLSLHIPLVTIGGRGSANYTLALSYNSKLWSSQHDQDPGYTDPMGTFIPPFDHYRATFDDAVMRQPNAIAFGAGWSILKGASIKVAQVNISPINPNSCSAQQISDDACGYKYILTKAWLTLPDGSEVELRDSLTNGAPALTPVDSFFYHPPVDRDRGRVWQSTDGSAITYISDANNGVVSGQLAGWVFLSDGTRLRMDAGPFEIGARCTQVIDRQGNFVSIDYNAPAGTTYTDGVGRQVVLQSTSSGLNVVVKGYSGVSDRVIVINTAMIGALDGSGVPTNLRADFRSLQRPFYSGDYSRTPAGDFPHTDTNPHTDLFPGSENTFKTDTYVTVTSMQLLDGRSFRFRYNQYGELAEIVYPGGGISQIDYAPGSPGAEAGCSTSPVILSVNRIVVQRRSLTNGVNVDAVWSYSGSSGLVDGVSYPLITVEARQGSSTGPLLLSEKHYFYALDADYRACRSTFFGFRIDDTGNEKWENAKEFRVERQTGSGTQIEKRTWEQRAAVVWAPDVGLGYNAYAVEFGQQQPANDPRVTVEDTILENGMMKRTTYDYDPFNNVTLTKEYDFGGIDGSLGSLVRQTVRTFGANIGSNYGISINGYCYSNLNPFDSSCGNGLPSVVSSIIHQRRLLLNETVKDANNNQKGYAELEYDNYTSVPNHAALIINAGMIQYDGTQFSSFASSYQPRGNVTKVTRWAGGTNYVYSFSQYDNAGNVIWNKDPNGNIATFSYADNFGNGSNPDSGVGGANGSTYALATLATNPLNHQAKTQYDYTRGIPTGSKDPNGVITKTEYDLLGRPTRVTAAVGLADQTMAETTYPSATAQVSTASKQLDATRWLASKSIADGFDRSVTSLQAEDGQHASVASFTLRVDTIYDPLGRVKQVSNPYRPGQGESAVFTTTAYDLSGRVTSVTTPDNAVVTTGYSGNEVTVTDQDQPTGKKRKSVTDGLGRLKEVYEDPLGLNYQTSYSYDVLDNLTTVFQGTQTRTFVYDSLKRLTLASNPESGTISYQYDNNGNLLVKTDARTVSTHYSYDALNRPMRRWYNSSSSLTATVHNSPALPATVGTSTEALFLYDSQTLPTGAPTFDRGFATGKLVAVTYGTGSSEGNYFGYDALGRPLRRIQQTGSVNYQVSAAYNLAGGVTSQTYPSGRTVNYTYDNAGRLSSFTGTLGDGVNRNYSTEIVYSPLGGMAKEKFGTDTPLYNKLFYNSRGQLSEIRVSSQYTGPTDTSWNRGAIINQYSNQCWGACNGSDNNGNLKKQEIYIPLNEQIPTTSWTQWWQGYEYDNLNRLEWVKEYNSSNTQLWQQQYVYDRWGNRRIDQNNTWGPNGSPTPPPINKKDFAIETSTNRLYAPGDLALPNEQRQMQYDTAGNLTKDLYTGAGDRIYDAENRMTKAWGGNNQLQEYTYNADGQRVRRKVDGIETWQIYGMDGELLAEYAANAAVASPQKEYGYRNGELLITADAPSGSARSNFALTANGGVASVSSVLSASFPASSLNNGDRKGLNWGNGGGWRDAEPGNTFPDSAQVEFNGSKTIDEVDVFTVQDNYASPSEPTETMTFSTYGLSGFEVQYWNESAWTTVPGGSVTGNNKVWKKITFDSVTTTKIRVLTNASVDGYSRLVEVEAWGDASATRTNVALVSNGGTVTVSSILSSSFPGESLNNSDRKGLNWGNGGGWRDAEPGNTFPDSVQVEFNGSKTIDEVDIFTVQDNYASPLEPTETMTFSTYGLSGFEVQYWNENAWTTVPGGSVTGSNKVWKKITFAPITTTKIRVLTNASPDGYSRLTEVEAWTVGSGGGAAQICWLVADQLGTPRMVFDKTGSLANTKRHDYLPFGEELYATQGLRTTQIGYFTPINFTGDTTRQQFTSKERDVETGLDYFLARYYSSIQGRFTSPDEFTGGPDELYYFADDASTNPTFYADFTNPQSLNKYQYVYNNPLRYTDDDGHCGVLCLAARAAAAGAKTPAGQRVINAAGAAATTAIVAASGVVKKIPGAFQEVFKGSGPGCLAGIDCRPTYMMNQKNDAPTEVTIDGSKHPEAAQHAADAQKAGQPDTLTVDRPGAKDRRREATSGTKPTEKKDRDEYPPAVTKEGGRGASVRPISPRDNRGAGASIGNQIKNVPDGGKIKIKVIKIELF